MDSPKGLEISATLHPSLSSSSSLNSPSTASTVDMPVSSTAVSSVPRTIDSASISSISTAPPAKKQNPNRKLGSIKNPDVTKRPCLSCNTRRIRCDLAKPSCNKCVSKNLECSYEKPFVFIYNNKVSKSRKNSIEKPYASNAISFATTTVSDNITKDNHYQHASTNNIIPSIDSNTTSFTSNDHAISHIDGTRIADTFANFEVPSSPDNLIKTIPPALLLNRETNSSNNGFSNSDFSDSDTDHTSVLKITSKDLQHDESSKMLGTWNFYRDQNVDSALNKTATLLSEAVPNCSLELILKLYDHFEDVILDVMVCYDSPNSPYRFILCPRAAYRLDLLATICTMSLTNFPDLKDNNEDFYNNFSALCFENSQISYNNLIKIVDQEPLYFKDINEIQPILDDCLNLLMQFSHTIFVKKDSTRQSPQKLRNYLTVVNKALLRISNIKRKEFELLTSFNKSYVMMVFQRYLINDILSCNINNWKTLNDTKLIDYVKDYELKLFKGELDFRMGSLLEVAGIPLEILDVLYKAEKYLNQVEAEKLDWTVNKVDDQTKEDKIIEQSNFMFRKSIELQQILVKAYQDYTHYFSTTYKLPSEDIETVYLKLVELVSNASMLIILERMLKLPRDSPQFIHFINKNLEILTQYIPIGSGPDSCILFALVICAQRCTLEKHKAATLNYLQLSHWHLQMGAHLLLIQALNKYYWSKKPSDPLDVDVGENFVIIY